MSPEIRYKFHSSAVEGWMTCLPKDLKKQALVELFTSSFKRVLAKASVSISAVTLNPILDRVLYNSSEQFPLLATVKIDKEGLNFADLEKSLKKYDDKQIKRAFHYLITEFFYVIGNLTGEQLTPLLHKELNESSKEKP
jgi:hypothetical protein